MHDIPMTPEILVPRLTDYLLEKDLLRPEDLEKALNEQGRLREAGTSRLIGQVLIDLGFITAETRDSAITDLISQLRGTLQEANQQLEIRVQERTAELQQALEKLSELNQLKANIVANISHELRTPLTHLKGYLELLMAGDLGPVTEAQLNGLTVMERSADRLGRLIEDLILFSISERDQIRLRITPILVGNLCVTALHKAGSKARDRGIQLLLECDSDLPEVDGDEEKISWVVLQFIDNAIKFTPSGGKVKLKAYREAPFVKIAVTDTGIGIPASRINEIFESFYQLDGSSTRRAGGTGLGLALAKKIVEAHGAIIRVNSEEGKGSCFEFFLKEHNSEPAADR